MGRESGKRVGRGQFSVIGVKQEKAGNIPEHKQTAHSAASPTARHDLNTGYDIYAA